MAPLPKEETQMETSIQKKFNALGGTAVFGKPVGQLSLIGHKAPAMQGAPDDKPEPQDTVLGWVQHYERGSIYVKGDDQGDGPPFAVLGALDKKYASLHGPQNMGALGFPVADPVDALKDGGSQSRFEHGVITLQPGQAIAHALLGDMASGWFAAGGLKGPGYPLADAAPVAGGAFVPCSNAARMFLKPSLGAHEVHGKILDTYLQEGGPGGSRGFPIANTQTLASGATFSDFENGVIAMRAGPGSVAFDVTALPLVSDPKAQGSLPGTQMFSRATDLIGKNIPPKVKFGASTYALSIDSGGAPRADTTQNFTTWIQRPNTAPFDPSGPVSDYTRVGGVLFNRGYRVFVRLQVDNPGPDIKVDVHLSAALTLNRQSGTITASPVVWNSDPDIPGITVFLANAFGPGAPTEWQVQDAVSSELQKLQQKTIPVVTLDPTVAPLIASVKTRTNGELSVYVVL
ncbi:hypothetical protein B7R77_23495 [Ralstonia solanacearum K60]|uniref:Uncharacterized protein n=2 Tax=Ralstonia TaxID=48736 RepID=A0AAP7ZIN9_RALSL|nr:hypothetical protein B7R77_23495 [Ralstonia solanacearum K60]RIJ84217.1 hypothetical protein RSP822_22555 [Ralstonia solanacearum]